MKYFLTHLPYVLAGCALLIIGLMPAVTAAPKEVFSASNVLAYKPLSAAVADSLAAAARPTVLKGKVLLRNGQPCAGASVYAAGAPRQLVVTDAQGTFTLPLAAGAAITLYIDYFGEGTSRVKVSLPLAEPLRITLGQ